ncbi:unnamed protein product, partial [Didymodactylos carnosus]
DELELYTPGALISWLQFSSSKRGKDVAQVFPKFRRFQSFDGYQILLKQQQVYDKQSLVHHTHNGEIRRRNDRYFDIENLQLRRSTFSIDGHQNTPPLPLDIAVQQLELLMSDIQLKVEKAKQGCRTFKDGLTEDESAAIYLYTMQWESGAPSLYHLLNKKLREETSRQQLEP